MARGKPSIKKSLAPLRTMALRISAMVTCKENQHMSYVAACSSSLSALNTWHNLQA
jgi:hypothetical protein